MASPSNSRPLNPGQPQTPQPSASDPLSTDESPHASGDLDTGALKFKSLSEIMSTTTIIHWPPDTSPIASSDSSWEPGDSPNHSGSSSSLSDHLLSDESHPPSPGPPHGDLDIYSPQRSSLGLKTPPKIPPHWQTALSPDGSRSPSPPVPVDPHPGLLSPGSRPVAPLVSEPQHFVNPPLTEEPYPSSADQLSTAESRPPTLEPTDNHPPPASPLNPGPSTERNPQAAPSTKRPRPVDDEWGSSLREIFRGKFKRRFSGSDGLNSAQGDLQDSFDSRTCVTTFSLPLLSTNEINR